MSGKRRNAPADEVARLYRLGLTMAEVAGIYGVSAWTIAARLDRAGMPRRSGSPNRAVLPVERAVRGYVRQPHRLPELAAELGISPQLIVDRSLRREPRERGQGRHRADVRPEEVADLYRAGWTMAQIAAKYDTASGTVLRRLDEAGVGRRPSSVPVVFPVEEAIRRVQQEGVSFAQLARDYKVGVESVRGQLKARGIDPPPITGPRVLRDIPTSQIASLYATGLTMTEIAALHGVCRETVSARLRAAGVARRSAGNPVPVAEATNLYRQGATLTCLAAKYKVRVGTVHRTLTAAGVTMRPRGGQRKPVPVPEAVELYAAGQTMRQLAERYHVSETVIYDRLTEAGAPIRRKTDRKQVDPGLFARLARQAGLDMVP
jgi:DNA-binding NarL/FixJ family response regulator